MMVVCNQENAYSADVKSAKPAVQGSRQKTAPKAKSGGKPSEKNKKKSAKKQKSIPPATTKNSEKSVPPQDKDAKIIWSAPAVPQIGDSENKREVVLEKISDTDEKEIAKTPENQDHIENPATPIVPAPAVQPQISTAAAADAPSDHVQTIAIEQPEVTATSTPIPHQMPQKAQQAESAGQQTAPAAPAPPPAKPAWDTPKTASANSSKTGVDTLTGFIKDTLSLQTLSGNIIYNFHAIELKTKKKGRTLSHSVTTGWQKKLGKDNTFTYNLTSNTQDVLVRNSNTLNSTYGLQMKKMNVQFTTSDGTTDETANDGRTSSNSRGNQQLNISLNAIKKMPVAMSFTKNTNGTTATGSASTSTTTKSYAFSASPVLGKKMRSTINYTVGDNSDDITGALTSNSSLALGLEMPLSNRFTMRTQFQKTDNDTTPANATDTTRTGVQRYVVGYDYKLTRSLTLASAFQFDSNDSTSSQGSTATKVSNLKYGLGWARGLFNAAMSFNTNTVSAGADTSDFNMTLGFSPNNRLMKTMGFTIASKRTEDAASAPQNSNANATLNYSVGITSRLNLTSQYTLTRDKNFQSAAGAAIQQNQIRMIKLDNPLGKTLSQSLQWQRNSASPASGSTSETDTYTHTIQKNWRKRINGKQLTASASRNWVMTSSEPASTDVENKVTTMSVSYPFSPSFNFNYNFSWNQSNTSGAATASNFTKQSGFALTYKSKRNVSGSLNYTYAGSYDGTKTKNLVFNLNYPVNRQTAFVMSLNRNVNKGSAQAVFFSGLSLNF